MGGYIFSLIIIGAYAYTKKKDDSLGDFYLAGRDMGVVVLLLTLYTTQYSGNTLFGFSGAAFREGLRFIVSIHFMTAIIGAYLLFAPRLYRISREHNFITPGDFIYYRFQSHALRIIVTLLMVYALCNFTLAQMKTLGIAFEGLSSGRIPLWIGVAGLTIIMLIYESLGGMRGVAWTDVMQGGILMIGFILLLLIVFVQIGDLPSAIKILAENPSTKFKTMPPDAQGARTWLSFILMVGLGAAIYPQAIQRLYAARNIGALKKSLAVMAFLPLLTAAIAVTVGIIMAAYRPDLGGMALLTGETTAPSETVLAVLCLEVMQSSDLGYWLVVIIFSAIFAAVMSTADSAMLSISSMVTKDLYGEYINPGATQKHLTKIGKWITWALMIPIAGFAIWYEGTLIELLKLKFDLLIQCVPAFYLGVHCKNLSARVVITGILVGLMVALGCSFSEALGISDHNYKRVWGFHAGVVGLSLNLLVCVVGIILNSKKKLSSEI
jgi:SSS family solute:Na+ symporter/sodium/pantothenate symporter